MHLLAAMQAVDLIGIDKMSSATREVYRKVRSVSPFVREDRVIDDEINAVAGLLNSDGLF
jgi:histidine ammonia-lyase/phenylalanine ammonia-lyase